MRSTHTYWLLVTGLALLLGACTGSKPMAKRAAKLEQAGLHAEAAEMFLQSVQRNNRNVDAKIGLKRTGQAVLDDRLSSFFKSVNMGGDRSDAVNAYLSAEAYADRVQRMGVILEIPDHYRNDFERVKGEHLVQLYEKGQALLEVEDYRGAETYFARIAELEPDYKDAGDLQRLAYLEPMYRAGVADLAGGRYRKAYEEFTMVIAKEPDFRDAKELREEAVRKGQFTIAVLPFSAPAGAKKDLPQRFMAFGITALTEMNDPFVRVVDRENMDRILEEQRLGMSGVVDEGTAVQVGNLMGAQAVLMGTVIDYREEPGELRRSTKSGFESYRVRLLNSETGKHYFETRYKPVRYAEFYQEHKVFASLSYKLVSLETGEVLMSRVVDRTSKDHVYYATYEGNTEALLPANNGIVNASARARNELATLIKGNRTIKPIGAISNDLLRGLSTDMTAQLQGELKSRLP